MTAEMRRDTIRAERAIGARWLAAALAAPVGSFDYTTKLYEARAHYLRAAFHARKLSMGGTR